MRTVLGVDAGGTRSRCVLVDETGYALAVGAGGPGNPHSVGKASAFRGLSEAIAAALASLPSGAGKPSCILISAAGGADHEGFDGLGAHLRTLVADAEVSVESDMLSAFCAGRSTESGYLLLSGTGAVAGRVERGVLVRVADGLGWLLGDEGSGFWIGREGALAALRAADGRGPTTALAQSFLRQFAPEPEPRLGRSPEVAGAIAQVYRRQRPVALAGFAGVVCDAAAHDEVAADIIARAADALLASWRAVQAPGISGTVLAGGVLSRPGTLRDAVLAQIPDAVVVGNGLVGAGLLALRALGIEAGEAHRERIAASLAGLA